MQCLKCPVCQKELFLNEKRSGYICEKNHCYDIANKGYTNMLLANQKHSTHPGDSKEMIASRVKFLELNYYSFLREEILKIIKKYSKNDKIFFCDLACGEGYYTNYLHSQLKQNYSIETIGIDISKYAIIEACKKRNCQKLTQIEYFIGNLMNLPFMDNSFTFMLNCFALLDEKEFHRVLKNKGYFIRVLPDKDHLFGLKKQLYENVILNEMKEKTIKGFKLVEEIHIQKEIFLKNSEEIYNLFTMTPYYYKSKKESVDHLLTLKNLSTIASFVLLVYQKEEI